jgi:hypothetical protein
MSEEIDWLNLLDINTEGKNSKKNNKTYLPMLEEVEWLDLLDTNTERKYS